MAEPRGSGRRSAQVVDVRRLCDDRRRLWRRLSVDSGDASPFLGPTFAEAAAVAFPVFATFISQGDRVVAVFPYQFACPLHRLFGAGERAGGELSDRAGIVAAPDFRIGPAELLRLAGLHSFLFSHLGQADVELGLAAERSEPGLMIDLAGGAEAFWAGRRRANAGFVRDTERRRRRLEAEVGPIHVAFESADVRDRVSALIAAKRAQYRRTGVPDPFAQPWAGRLVETLAGCVQPDCTGLFSSLHAGDTWVASHFGLRCGETLHYWFPVYRPEFHKYAPGRLLLAETINAAAALGIRRIGRGQGDSPAKRDFATGEQTFWRGLWYRPGLRSLCYRLERAWHWRWGGAAR